MLFANADSGVCSCTLAVTNEPAKVYRWELIMSLSDLALADNIMDIQMWCQRHQSMMLRSLDQLNPQDVKWLIDVSIIGGIEFLTKMQVFFCIFR
jgi:hypothetical protein